MSDINNLKVKLLEAVHNRPDKDTFDIILSPISDYFTGSDFIISEVKDIIMIITKDRDNNNEFNIDDIKLIGENVVVVSNLISSVLLLLSKLPDVKIKYRENESEMLVFKILSYIFLVLIPAITRTNFLPGDYNDIVNVIVSVYKTTESLGLVKALIDMVVGIAKNTSCGCVPNKTENKHKAINREIKLCRSSLAVEANKMRVLRTNYV